MAERANHRLPAQERALRQAHGAGKRINPPMSQKTRIRKKLKEDKSQIRESEWRALWKLEEAADDS